MTVSLSPGGLASAELLAAVEAARALGRRVSRARADGRDVWIKFAVEKRLILRLQKGPAAALLVREREVLREMRARGAPVAAILVEGADFVVTEDGGATLAERLRKTPDDPALPAIFVGTGRALARLHRLGLAHGRPHLRDICWSDERQAATFIDLERGARLKAGTYDFGRDLFIFVFAFYSVLPGGAAHPALAAFWRAYLEDSPDGVCEEVERWCRRWRILVPLSRPLRWHERRFKPRRIYKEYSALEPTFRHFGVGGRG